VPCALIETVGYVAAEWAARQGMEKK